MSQSHERMQNNSNQRIGLSQDQMIASLQEALAKALEENEFLREEIIVLEATFAAMQQKLERLEVIKKTKAIRKQPARKAKKRIDYFHISK